MFVSKVPLKIGQLMLVLFNFGDRIKEKGLVLTQKVFLSGFLGYQKRKEKKKRPNKHSNVSFWVKSKHFV